MFKGEIWKVNQGGMRSFGTFDKTGKMIAILTGEEWCPQMAQKGEARYVKSFCVM